MSSEMVERVARAIFDRIQQGRVMRFNWEIMKAGGEALLFFHAAEAAIEAMREPTAGMGSAGARSISEEAFVIDAEHCWRDMIDAARGS